MEDPNQIAYLLPANEDKGYALEAIRMPENALRYIPPQGETRSDYRSRETTASLEDEESNTVNTSHPRLLLTFNPGPKAGLGLLFGTDPNCDIVLPKLRHISQRHCYLTFDGQGRLILRDFSRYGSIVTYDSKGQETRRQFTWILGGHIIPQKTRRIVLEIQDIKFRIIVSRHDQHPALYSDNVDQFRLGALGFQSGSSTTALSGATTPPKDPIRLEQETLGAGAFAIVKRVWDVSTGIEYAYKEPLDTKKVDRKAWEKEADIMNQISHDHVVKLLEDRSYPWPRLALEYVPCGSLEDQHQRANFSIEECLAILCQGLSVLVDLHGRQYPIVHRDIKPQNVLVESRYPLYIKFSDFGLSKEGSSLTTICGSGTYLAPEIARYFGVPKSVPKLKYKSSVDIWSLGVVIVRYAYGLPYPGGGIGLSWCGTIVNMLDDWDSEHLVDFLLTAMIVLKPELRYSAQRCYEEALQLPVPPEDRVITPKPTSNAEGYTPKMVKEHAEEQGVRGQQNQPVSSPTYLSQAAAEMRAEAILGELFTEELKSPLPEDRRSSPHEDSIRSSDIRRYIRSEAPPPEPYTTRKRSTRSSTNSSSGGRNTKRKGKAVSSSRRSGRAESEPIINLFGQDWLQDPNCVGSSVAAMGQEEPSSVTGEPSMESVPRSIPEPVHEQDDYYDPHFVEGGEAFAPDANVVESAAEGGAEGPWINSDDYMAANLLYAIHEQRH